MKNYYAETYSGRNVPIVIQANTDDEAIEKFKEKYGEHLVGVIGIWCGEIGFADARTVWLE